MLAGSHRRVKMFLCEIVDASSKAEDTVLPDAIIAL
jgi:hypothetical protein